MSELSKPGVVESRQRVEEGLEELRSALDRTTGMVPRGKTWVVPVLAAAVGLALALALRGRR